MPLCLIHVVESRILVPRISVSPASLEDTSHRPILVLLVQAHPAVQARWCLAARSCQRRRLGARPRLLRLRRPAPGQHSPSSPQVRLCILVVTTILRQLVLAERSTDPPLTTLPTLSSCVQRSVPLTNTSVLNTALSAFVEIPLHQERVQRLLAATSRARVISMSTVVVAIVSMLTCSPC